MSETNTQKKVELKDNQFLYENEIITVEYYDKNQQAPINLELGFISKKTHFELKEVLTEPIQVKTVLNTIIQNIDESKT